MIAAQIIGLPLEAVATRKAPFINKYLGSWVGWRGGVGLTAIPDDGSSSCNIIHAQDIWLSTTGWCSARMSSSLVLFIGLTYNRRYIYSSSSSFQQFIHHSWNRWGPLNRLTAPILSQLIGTWDAGVSQYHHHHLHCFFITTVVIKLILINITSWQRERGWWSLGEAFLLLLNYRSGW